MYQLLLETLLGFTRTGNQLRLTPRLPKNWSTCTVHYRYIHTTYHVQISGLTAGSAGLERLVLDGQELPGNTFPLYDDLLEHSVSVQCSGSPEWHKQADAPSSPQRID
jgi:cellobiose phosphorylase